MKRVILALLFAVLMASAAMASVDGTDEVDVDLTIDQALEFNITQETFSETIPLSDQKDGRWDKGNAFQFTWTSNSDWYSMTHIDNWSCDSTLDTTNWVLHIEGISEWYYIDVEDGASVGPGNTPEGPGTGNHWGDVYIDGLALTDGYGTVEFDLNFDVSFDNTF